MNGTALANDHDHITQSPQGCAKLEDRGGTAARTGFPGP